MKISVVLLAVAVLYQLLRFAVLFFSSFLALHGTAATGATMLILALSAPALVAVLLLIRLGFSGASAVINPLRTMALLQVLTATALLVSVVRSPLPLIPTLPGMTLVAALIITVSDFAFLVFLLLYRTSMEET